MNYVFGFVSAFFFWNFLGMYGMYMGWWAWNVKPGWLDIIVAGLIAGIANHPPIFAKCKHVIGAGVGLTVGIFIFDWLFYDVFGLESLDGIRWWVFLTTLIACAILGGIYHLPTIPDKMKGAIIGAATGAMIVGILIVVLLPFALFFPSLLGWMDWLPENERANALLWLSTTALGAWIGSQNTEHGEETEQAREAG